MGGVLIIISIVVPRCSGPICASRMSGSPRRAVAFGWIGFLDDYAKVMKRRNLGLTSGRKLLYKSGGLRFSPAAVHGAYGGYSTY